MAYFPKPNQNRIPFRAGKGFESTAERQERLDRAKKFDEIASAILDQIQTHIQPDEVEELMHHIMRQADERTKNVWK